eukprot:7380549-Prymnesium_polylepis.2
MPATTAAAGRVRRTSTAHRRVSRLPGRSAHKNLFPCRPRCGTLELLQPRPHDRVRVAAIPLPALGPALCLARRPTKSVPVRAGLVAIVRVLLGRDEVDEEEDQAHRERREGVPRQEAERRERRHVAHRLAPPAVGQPPVVLVVDAHLARQRALREVADRLRVGGVARRVDGVALGLVVDEHQP